MIKAKKDLGQNFLTDAIIINQIIETINPDAEDTFLEIGPGRGAITEPLLKSIKYLHAVEIDRDLIKALENIKNTNLLIHNNSILKFQLEQLGDRNLRVIGNLPYNISTQIMLWTFENLKMFKDIHFMFQKEFGERLSAEPNNKSYGRISVLTQYLTELDTTLYLEPESFKPRPSVESVFIKFIPIKDRHFLSPVSIKLQEVTKEAFMHRRKMIGKSLKKILTSEQLDKLDIDLSLRPENISVNDYIRIAKALI